MFKKIIPLLLLILLITQLTLIHIHIASDHDHENCRICSEIYAFKNSYSSGTNQIILVLITYIPILELIYRIISYNKKEKTLIGLKVELNN